MASSVREKCSDSLQSVDIFCWSVSEVSVSRVSRALWGSSVYPLFFIYTPLSLSLSFPFSTWQTIFLFFPAVFSPLIFYILCGHSCLLLSFATFLFQVFILCFPAPLARSSLLCPLGQWRNPQAGLEGGGQWVAFEWQPCVGLAAWPLSFCQGKWREPREVEQCGG